ncbi:hypothetical protein FACS1894216_08210 [Synergistales bacterium]|nr:hypothetical protein FACS1894216_08210 [Synergistales bacterium]
MPVSPIHPGEILKDEIDAVNMSAAQLCRNYSRFSQSCQANNIGEEKYFRRHSHTPWYILRNRSSILAEITVRV